MQIIATSDAHYTGRRSRKTQTGDRHIRSILQEHLERSGKTIRRPPKGRKKQNLRSSRPLNRPNFHHLSR